MMILVIVNMIIFIVKGHQIGIIIIIFYEIVN